MKLQGCVISDIHIGAFDLETQYNELKNGFLLELNQLDKLDLLVLCGDFFDKLFMLNSAEAIYARKILIELSVICKKFNTVLRIVYGTESHDSHQYDIFTYIFKFYEIDYKVIYTVSSERLFDTIDILYLPEEYLDDFSVYNDFFNKTYDYIFGHGVIREGMKMAALTIENSDTKRKHVPVFKSNQLKSICKGDVYFGHYHVNCEMIPNVFYVGSYCRWKHDEEQDKGYYIFNYNSKKELYSREFIVNQHAQIFDTITFGINHPIYNNMDVFDEWLGKLNKDIKNRFNDHIRLKFTIPDNCNNPEYIIQTVNNTFKNNKYVKPNITYGYMEKQKEETKKEVDNENDKYEFIFDKSMPKEDMLSTYLSIDFNYDITSEDISNYLYKPLNEILSE